MKFLGLENKLNSLNVPFEVEEYSNSSDVEFMLFGNDCIADLHEGKILNYHIVKGYDEANQEHRRIFFNTFRALFNYAKENKI